MKLNYAIGQFAKAEFPEPMGRREELIEGSVELQTVAVQFRRSSGDFTTINAFVNGRFVHGISVRAGNRYSWLNQLEEFSSNGFSGTASVRHQNRLQVAARPDETEILFSVSEAELENLAFPDGPKISNPPHRFMIWLEPIE